MTRSQGRKTSRVPSQWPATGEEAEIGWSDRTQGVPSPIPGGRDHIVNAPTHRQNVPIGVPRPEIRDGNAHGVLPDTHTARERADLQRGQTGIKAPHLHTAAPVEPVAPVPVYMVQYGGGGDVLLSSAPHHITVPASTAEPVRLCGRDLNRKRVMILNESTSSDVRFGQRIADLNNGGGALLPWPANSYLTLHTQDELYALSADSGTPVVSVIQEFEQPW
jgi:hypothetical protein